MNHKINLGFLRGLNVWMTVVMALSILHSCIPTKSTREAKIALPDTYAQVRAKNNDLTSLDWREFFDDPLLQDLIDTALTRNQELNLMLLQVEIANNEVRDRKGEYLPFLKFYAGAEAEKSGAYTRNGAIEENLDIREGEAFPEPLSDFGLGLAASWELDIWKRLRNSKKSAVYEFLATQEGKNFMVTNLVAEIASAYYELTAMDNKLALIEQNLELQENALVMVKLQKQAARATELAVRRFEAEVLKNQSQRYVIQQQIVLLENRINFLLGRFPQRIARNSENFTRQELPLVKAGIPSQIVSNRADIRRAELEMEAAKIDVNVARARFLPAVSLDARLGFQAFDPKFLLTTPESLVYSVISDLAVPLVNRNAIKAAYANASARQVQAVIEYEQTILQAYGEVLNQLSNLDNLASSYALKVRQVEALTEAIDIATRLYQSARSEYLEVLLTQREVLESRMELVETKKEQRLAQVQLFHALGGGWQ